MCEEGAPSIAPTVDHAITHDGIYGGYVPQRPWLAKNVLPLAVGSLGGALLAALVMHLTGRGRARPTEAAAEGDSYYHAMGSTR